ncbi:MAG TPA: GAF domain-containing protein, partial [Phycisphaerae bacterium]|nr:GAF domain-containing protein [Phycisphaerae bacterium]
GRSFVVDDVYGDLSAIDSELQFDSHWDKINKFRTRDIMCSPVCFKGKVTGVVQLVNSVTKAFSKNDVPALEDVARLIGYALYHARLHENLASMKQLDVEKAQFMRVMVHELKSPVSAAKMLADVLKAEPGLSDDVEHLSGRITERLDQLGGLIMDILELAQVKSGKPLGQVDVLDMAGATRTCCDGLAAQARSKGLELNVTIPKDEILTRIDSQGYQLIVSNLIGNAVKYTPSGSVTVDLRTEDQWAVLEVTDTGIGIPEGDIPKLFKEFFRAGNAKASKIPGSGVGLAGVKSIVDRFRGQIEFQTRQNEGTTFTVRLAVFQP